MSSETRREQIYINTEDARKAVRFLGANGGTLDVYPPGGTLVASEEEYRPDNLLEDQVGLPSYRYIVNGPKMAAPGTLVAQFRYDIKDNSIDVDLHFKTMDKNISRMHISKSGSFSVIPHHNKVYPVRKVEWISETE